MSHSPSGVNTHSTHSARQSGKVFIIVCVGIVLANMDLFSINIALPRIASDFRGTRLEDQSWILNAYAIAYAALLVFFGRLTEGMRRDRSFVIGIGIFSSAALACAAATGIWQLVFFRVIAASGAALMTPTSLGLLLATFPPERRGAAVRNWAAVGGFAAALGPLVGGLLASANWRYIFLLNAFIGFIAMSIALRKLPVVAGHPTQRPSLIAALLFTLGICSLIFTIVKVNAWGWSVEIIVSAMAAIILLGLFIMHALRSSNPLLNPGLFRIKTFTGAALAIFPYSVSFGAMLFSVAIWGQSAWGWSALQAGLAIIPGPLLVPITSMLLTNLLIGRFGNAFVVITGSLFVVCGFMFWATFLGVEQNAPVLIVGMALNGIGVGLTFPTLMGVSSHDLPASSFATGSGMINMLRQAAIAIGVAIFVAIIGSPLSVQERLAAFQLGWKVMAGITLLTLIPAYLYLRTGRNVVTSISSQNSGERE